MRVSLSDQLDTRLLDAALRELERPGEDQLIAEVAVLTHGLVA
jgi:hypothetical protein